MIRSTSTTSGRRRLAAAALALPLALTLTGTAFAAGPSAELRTSSAPAAEERGNDKAAPQGGAAAPQKQAQAEPQAAKSEPKSEPKPASKPKSEPRTESKPQPQAESKAQPQPKAEQPAKSSGSNSSKDDRPTEPVSGTPSQPISKADGNGNGANPGSAEECAQSNPYCSNGTGQPSGNGKGDGGANGKPCAGCVGKADNKNPPGQAPGGSDGNAGYECDRNQGIGKTNPAHTGCSPDDTDTGETPPVDVCPDVPGNQPTGTPCPIGGGDGGGGSIDLCPLVPGMQDSVTECEGTPPIDVCPSVDGMQDSVTECEGTPPIDFCPGVDGMQDDVSQCTPPTQRDVCPDVDGMQLMGPCTTDLGGTTPPAPGSGNSPDAEQPQPGVISNGSTPREIETAAPAAPRNRVVPSALPFTGTDAALLLTLGLVLLVGGSGLAVATRKERTARTAA